MSFYSALLHLVPSQRFDDIIEVQSKTLEKYERTNAILYTVLDLSNARYRVLEKSIKAKTVTLYQLKLKMDSIHRKIRYIQSKIKKNYPIEYQQSHDKLYKPANLVKGLVLGVQDLFSSLFYGSLQSIVAIRDLHKSSRNAYCTRTILMGALLSLASCLALGLCYLSNSIVMIAIFNLLVLDLFLVGISLITMWTESHSPNLERHCFGYERFQVVSVFTGTIVSLLLSFFLVKESVERFITPAIVYMDYLFLGSGLVLIMHLLTVYSVYNPAIKYAIAESDPNFFQDHLSDMAKGLSQSYPQLSAFLLPRINPIMLLGVVTFALSIYTDLDLQSDRKYLEVLMKKAQTDDPADLEYTQIDTICGVLSALATIITMLPLAKYTGKILLQTCPNRMAPMVERSIRECYTVPGVVEFKNEHFWSVGFGYVCGSLWVRVKQDADEQQVTARIFNKFSAYAQRLSVQVYKDSWSAMPQAYNHRH